jgi:AraC family transcriptional activator of pobA
MSARTPKAQRLPAFALYGEPGRSGPEPLHWESIAERSRLHDWEIRPHRHEALFQLLVAQSGDFEAWLDGRRVVLQGPALVTVPALVAHGFVFAPAIVGWVFTVSELHLAALLQPHPGLKEAVMRLYGAALPAAEAAPLLAAAAALRDETRGAGGWRAAALDAALLRLAVAAARAAPAPRALPAGPAGARALAHVQRLRALVEAQYRRQPGQAALAAQLGITPTQLNRACQQVLGHPAQGVLHARLLLQAQRELAYTELPIKQIAFELGFSDAAYFTRFFRRQAGVAPAAWRAARRHAAQAG